MKIDVLAGLLWILDNCWADKVVYLDRPGFFLPDAPGWIMFEPFFSPKSIAADIGEQVRFIARLKDLANFQYTDVLYSQMKLKSFN